MYAETIGFTPGQEYDMTTTQSQSIRALSEAASENRIWLIGGALTTWRYSDQSILTMNQVRYPKEMLLTASSTILASYSHQKAWHDCIFRPLSFTLLPGKLVATHRKVHLFDIDIPGKITFKVRVLFSQR